jgi:hypothetical protein
LRSILFIDCIISFRLQGGLFQLQFIDYIILEICCCGASTVKQRVLQILNLRGGTLKTVRDVVRLVKFPEFWSRA